MTGFAFATSERCSMVDQAHFESLEMPRVENWCGMGKWFVTLGPDPRVYPSFRRWMLGSGPSMTRKCKSFDLI